MREDKVKTNRWDPRQGGLFETTEANSPLVPHFEGDVEISPIFSGEDVGGSVPLEKPWREAPAALFLSWPLKRQLAYCAARDRDSAREWPGDAAWYLERAEGYEADMRTLCTTVEKH